MAISRICSIPDCGKPRGTRGFCEKHYRRWLRHGDPLGGSTFDGAPKAFLNDVALNYSDDECLIWPFALAGTGYPTIHIKGRMKRVHRLVCQHFYGDPPTDKHEAAHGCGNARCVNHRHLRWATTVENHADKIGHGTLQRGERNGKSTLTVDQVSEIKKLLAAGMHIDREIASISGATRRQVNTIKLGRCWAWL